MIELTIDQMRELGKVLFIIGAIGVLQPRALFTVFLAVGIVLLIKLGI